MRPGEPAATVRYVLCGICYVLMPRVADEHLGYSRTTCYAVNS